MLHGTLISRIIPLEVLKKLHGCFNVASMSVSWAVSEAEGRCAQPSHHPQRLGLDIQIWHFKAIDLITSGLSVVLAPHEYEYE